MRILCLHGQGTSAQIFKSQTVALRNKLPSHYTFDFLDAPFHCSPAPGIKVLFSSGTYTWWPRPTINAIRGAHQYMLDHIESHGPYDAVMGFSQGCSLIISYLLYHARETPSEPLPFRAAIFICGGLPLQVLEDLDLPVSQKAYEINDETVRLLKARAGALTALAADPSRITPGTGLWDELEGLVHDPEVMPDEEDVFGLDFTIIPRDMRVKIPTVHVYGAKDPRWPASMQLAHFCERREMYDHRGGHDIPRSTDVSVKIAQLVEGLAEKVGVKG
ncbi:family of serine hydrolases 1 [Podospora aff. communis PSN243]|uniref:Family of serine hydrolases 1 n=1 Tax=Podospora aff. communis PSN243 TaxID=3040156 RepID=A0AAV9GQU3_9PEZI|nr:family of serine hydrolases 1 [Podospora aff. communis PSN243]